MRKFKMTNAHDGKIINFDVANGFDAFIKLFTDDEVAEMRSWLEDDEIGYNYSWGSLEDTRDGIIVDYVKEWLCQNIRNLTYNGTEQLFKILYEM